MKEAAGEANMTVITIVLIGVVLVAGGFIVRSLTANTKKQSCCTSAGGTWSNGACTGGGTAYTTCLSGNGQEATIQ